MKRSALFDLRYLKSLRDIRGWLGMSLKDVGELCGVSPQLVNDWSISRRVMPQSAIERIGVKVADKVSDDIGRMAGVKVIVNGQWSITAWAQCQQCKQWFELHRRRDRRCEQCRGKNATA